MKNTIRISILLATVFVVILLIAYLHLNIFAQNGKMTFGQYAVKLAQSMDIGYSLDKSASESDYMKLLEGYGIKFPEGGTADKVITDKGKSYLLLQAHKIKGKLYKSEMADTDIFRDKAVIIDKNGKVMMKREKSADWISAELNMKLGQGDTIKTYADSWAKLRVGVGGRIEVKEDSELQLKTLTTASDKISEKVLIYLAMGEVEVDVRNIKEGSVFETHTPTTLAAVRGTVYTVIVKPKEGRVEVIEDISKRVPK